ncbi:hypothetical protein ANO11243_061670 [Dothideomycetidae sp. 11243]|nr:hypothetical protein ANO11243_061670 [fungal sp. No.11243]
MTTLFEEKKGPNTFSTSVQQFLESGKGPSAHATASDLASTVTSSDDVDNALWELWDAFFNAVARSPTPHTAHLTLLSAFAALPPSRPGSQESSRHAQSDGSLRWADLPGFSAQWRDVHDILESRRGEGGFPAEAFLRFCSFSAVYLRDTRGAGQVHPINVIYAARGTLERDAPKTETLSLDVNVASVWIRDGGQTLWDSDHDSLRQHWATTLDHPTDRWPDGRGLTRERWAMWQERLKTLSVDEGELDKDTKAVAGEAANVIGALLEEHH